MRDLYHDDLPDLPDPPPRPTDFKTYRVQRVENDLRKSYEEPHDAAYRLSHALCSLQLALQDRHNARPDPAQRDALLAHLARAPGTIRGLFHTAEDREIMATAFDGAVLMICHWAASNADRAARPRDLLTSAQQWVRWLRNACHNLSIVSEYRRERGTGDWHQCVLRWLLLRRLGSEGLPHQRVLRSADRASHMIHVQRKNSCSSYRLCSQCGAIVKGPATQKHFAEITSRAEKSLTRSTKGMAMKWGPYGI